MSPLKTIQWHLMLLRRQSRLLSVADQALDAMGPAHLPSFVSSDSPSWALPFLVLHT